MVDREKVMKGLRCLSNPYIQDMDERDCENCKYDNACCFLDVTADAISLLKAQEPGWISVKDRLPEGKTNPVTLDFNEVICFCDFGGAPKRTDVRTYKFGQRLGDTIPHFWHGPQIMDDVVTHYQYLPEPPKEET